VARGALLVVALLALVLGIRALGTGGSGGSASEKTGRPVSMSALDGETVVANAHLSQYSSPPPSLRIELTPGGPRFQLLLFNRLADVRRFTRLPTSAFLVLGGGANGDLSTGNTHDTGYTRDYGPELPANFRQYRFFGIARVSGSKRQLVLYERTDRLSDPT
jgi:hypothetical protein